MKGKRKTQKQKMTKENRNSNKSNMKSANKTKMEY